MMFFGRYRKREIRCFASEKRRLTCSAAHHHWGFLEQLCWSEVFMRLEYHMRSRHGLFSLLQS